MPRIATYTAAFALAPLPFLRRPVRAAVAKPTVEVAFVLDTTGSMGGLDRKAPSADFWSTATAIVEQQSDRRRPLWPFVAYRDLPGDDYVTKTFDLHHRHPRILYANCWGVESPRRRRLGESSTRRLVDVRVHKLRWTLSSDTRRIVFLVGDAPPHMDYAQDDTLSVKQRNIRCRPVSCAQTPNAVVARYRHRTWQPAASCPIPAGPRPASVSSSRRPYDEDIIILPGKSTAPYSPYGPAPIRSEPKTDPELSQVCGPAGVCRAWFRNCELSQQRAGLSGRKRVTGARRPGQRRRGGRQKTFRRFQGRRIGPACGR